MVKVSICCRRRVATCFLAPWLVTRIAIRIALMYNQKGLPRKSKKTPVTTFTSPAKTIEILRLKNGIVLTIKPAEQMGRIIVDAGRMIQAQSSEVNITRMVTPLQKARNILVDLAMMSSGANNPPAKKCTFPKRAPGSVTCANNNINTT